LFPHARLVVPITVGEGCVHPDASDATRVVCAIPTGTPASNVSMDVDLGGGNDALVLRAGSGNAVGGGPGDDEMDVNADTYRVRGDAGDDQLLGGACYLYGNDGNDHVIGGDRNQYLSGGPATTTSRPVPALTWCSATAARTLIRSAL
jgi:Ca2+-binding RTX toxin-like protein